MADQHDGTFGPKRATWIGLVAGGVAAVVVAGVASFFWLQAPDAMPAGPSFYWYVADEAKVQNASLDGQHRTDILQETDLSAQGPPGLLDLYVDAVNGQLYWLIPAQDYIATGSVILNRASLDGSQGERSEPFFFGGSVPDFLVPFSDYGRLRFPDFVADPARRDVYLNAFGFSIEVGDFEGGLLRPLITAQRLAEALGEPSVEIQAFAFHPGESALYLAANTRTPAAVRATLVKVDLFDGAVTPLLAGLTWLGNLALDPVGKWLYFAEIDARGQAIQRVGLDGARREPVVDVVDFDTLAQFELAKFGKGFWSNLALDLEAGKLYWTAPGNADNVVIHRANLDGTASEALQDGVAAKDAIALLPEAHTSGP